jgi:hypothetical protein
LGQLRQNFAISQGEHEKQRMNERLQAGHVWIVVRKVFWQRKDFEKKKLNYLTWHPLGQALFHDLL